MNQSSNRNDFLSACRQSNKEKILELLESEPWLINCSDDRLKLTPLFHTIIEENIEIAELLLSRGAEVNHQNSLGETALHHTSNQSLLSLTKLLVSQGADPNIKNFEGETPLHFAAYRADSPTIKVLMDSGADINARNKAGKAPLDIAQEESVEECIVENSYYKIGDLDLLEHTELFEFLCDSKAEKYLSMFVRAGYSNVDKLLDDAKTYALNLEDFRKIGIQEYGICIAVLLKLDKKLGRLQNAIITYPERMNKKTKSIWNCCSNFTDISHIYTVDDWLISIGLSQYSQQFEEAGFDDLQMLFVQTHSRFPMTDTILREIGVNIKQDRAKILNQLSEDCQLFIGSELVPETTEKMVSCQCLVF